MATRQLVDEHRLILGALDGLEALAAGVDSGESPNRKDVVDFVEFFSQFADGCHRGKEEDVLFAALADSGYPLTRAPIAALAKEHATGRRMVGELRRVAEKRGDWSSEDGELFSGAAQRYALLLRDHIRKENEVLLPLAESQLNAEQLARVDELFDLFERRRNSTGETERLTRLAERLVAKYPAAPRPQAPAPERVSSCCGL